MKYLLILLIVPVSFLPNASFAKDPTLNQNSSKKNNEISPYQLVQQAEDLYRSESSYVEMAMTVTNPAWERTFEIKAWSKTDKFSLIRIISPKKDRGISFLRKDKQMWNYLPKVDRQFKIPASMMMGSWMGSDFNNDDLVQRTSLTKDYVIELQTNKNTYLLTLKPKQKTISVWGKISIEIEKETKIPLVYSYFDEKGQPIRKMVFSEVKSYKKIRVPSKIEMIPLNKKDHKTTIIYNKIEQNIPIKENFFSSQNMKKRNLKR